METLRRHRATGTRGQENYFVWYKSWHGYERGQCKIMDLIILNDGMYQLVPLTKQMMEHMSLVVKELDLFDLCDIVRLKLTTYHDYPINAHVMNDGSGQFYGCIQN